MREKRQGILECHPLTDSETVRDDEAFYRSLLIKKPYTKIDVWLYPIVFLRNFYSAAVSATSSSSSA